MVPSSSIVLSPIVNQTHFLFPLLTKRTLVDIEPWCKSRMRSNVTAVAAVNLWGTHWWFTGRSILIIDIEMRANSQFWSNDRSKGASFGPNSRVFDISSTLVWMGLAAEPPTRPPNVERKCDASANLVSAVIFKTFERVIVESWLQSRRRTEMRGNFFSPELCFAPNRVPA